MTSSRSDDVINLTSESKSSGSITYSPKHVRSASSFANKTAGGVQNFKKMRYGGFCSFTPPQPKCVGGSNLYGTLTEVGPTYPHTNRPLNIFLLGSVPGNDNPRKSLRSTLIHPFFNTHFSVCVRQRV